MNLFNYLIIHNKNNYKCSIVPRIFNEIKSIFTKYRENFQNKQKKYIIICWICLYITLIVYGLIGKLVRPFKSMNIKGGLDKT